MKRFLYYIILILMPAILSGQGLIKGTVLDKQTNKPLEGASIYLKELNQGTTSNENGEFKFSSIPSGTYSISVSYMGYTDSLFHIHVNHNQKITLLTCFLIPRSIEISSVVISATRTLQNTEDIPTRIDVVSQSQLTNYPGLTADDYLTMISGVNVDRFYGIFNKSGNVTLRGLNRNVHSLILIDGVPYSLIDGGASNWNRVNVQNIEKIEILKGPASYLYGSNAMGGVINIITKRPTKKISAFAKAFYGTYNTQGGMLSFDGKPEKRFKNFYWATNVFYRKSDGYIMEPEATRDSTDAKTYLKEISSTSKIGYQINPTNQVELEYTYTLDDRGAGTKVYEPEGSFNNYLTHYARMNYTGRIYSTSINVNLFYKVEDYYRQNEGIKKTGTYSLYNTRSISGDQGIWMNLTRTFFSTHEITAGMDLKQGYVNSGDIYRTSTDTIQYAGKMNFYGYFIQDEWSLLKNRKLRFITGLRYDLIEFTDGRYTVLDPSIIGSFLLDYQKNNLKKTWEVVTPKIALQYKFNPNDKVYLSYAKGFRAPSMSDLCYTGDVSKGFKLANPYLKAESVDNYEAGATLAINKKIKIAPTVFYSTGNNFQYFVGTGDSIQTTGAKLKPIIRRENISGVEIYGAELGTTIEPTTNLSFILNYTFNHSQIKEASVINGSSIKNLSEKYLIEVPKHQLFCSALWKNNYVNATLNYKYKSDQWTDDENTIKISSNSIFDLKLIKTIHTHYTVSLTIQNIFNTKYYDSKGLLNPGRFIIGELAYQF